MYTPFKVLVTGGAGFIGSRICRLLQARGCHVVVVDDLSTGRADKLPAGVALVVGDVRDSKLLREALTGVDAVFHLAARVTIRGSVDGFLHDASTNVMGTVALLDACRGSSVKRL